MIRPLFRTMKCLDRYTGSAEGKCRIFVDEFGWVYQNWNYFKTQTLYPDTMIVAPVVGVFRRNEESGDVRLEIFKVPKTAEQILKENGIRTGLTVAGVGLTGVLVSAAVFPVSAPIVVGAAVVGSVVGAVSGVISAFKLWNRYKHEQSIGLGHKEARAHWLAVSETALGFLTSGSTFVLRGAATAGTVSNDLIYSANGLMHSSIIVNGVSIGNNIWTVSTDDMPMTSANFLQLSASLFLFTHSISNFRTAQMIVQETQLEHLSDYKQTLSKNGQKRFRNRLNQRNKAMGTAKGTGDTIRNLNTAEHYNNHFKGTDGYKSTSGFMEDEITIEKLLNSFEKYVPTSMTALVAIYKVVVTATSEDYWKLFKKMAITIMERIFNGVVMSIEEVIAVCFKLTKEYADRIEIPIKDVLDSFDGLSYDSILKCVREWFEMFISRAGTDKCKECGGSKYNI